MTWWERVQWALFRGLVGEIRNLGETIMTQVDDLKAALTEIDSKLDGVNAKVDEVKSETQAVGVEVKSLIDLLSKANPDLTAVLAQARAISDRVGVLQGKVDAVDADLDAIPPAPAA